MQKKDFRNDINGLRAYAVALVVLFHFNVLGFSAGFIGVDIFFVISGFLMTSVIVNGLEKNRFSLLQFYLSRAIRIIPALFVLCIVLLVLGWFLLFPEEYKALAKHTYSSINFYSNLKYYKEVGYFAVSAHNRALLHTWSLSVEWQFYLLFPILLLLLYKYCQRKVLIITTLAILMLLSLVYSIFISNQDQALGFYHLSSRAWEMLAGSLVYFISRRIKNGKIIEIIGFFILLISLFLFDKSTLWPSYHALLPVIGSALILLAQQNDSYLTRGRVFQWLGNNSYSIYLWHWPIVFYWYYLNLMDNTYYVALGIILSIILGGLSYLCVENLLRTKLSNKPKIKVFVLWLICVLGLTLFCKYIVKHQGIYHRFSAQLNQILKAQQDINPRRKECLIRPDIQKLKSCRYGEGATKLLVIGDSHADGMMQGIVAMLPPHSSLVSWTISGCPLAIGLKRTDRPQEACGEMIAKIVQQVRSYPKDTPILVVNRINALFAGEPENEKTDIPPRYIVSQHQAYDQQYIREMQQAYIATLATLAQSHPVFVTRPTPEAHTSIPPALAHAVQKQVDSDLLRISWSEYRQRSAAAYTAQDFAAKKYNIRIIEVEKLFCDQKYCSFIQNQLPWFYDDDHISWHAGLKLTPLLKMHIPIH